MRVREHHIFIGIECAVDRAFEVEIELQSGERLSSFEVEGRIRY